MDQIIRLVELFHQISRKIGKTLRPMFHQLELSHSDLVVLFIMGKRKTSRATDLAEAIGLPASTLTGVLDRLAGQGFLVREPDPADRRSLLLTATPALYTFLRGLMKPMEERLRVVFQDTPAARLNRLVEDLEFVLEVLEKTDHHSETKDRSGSSG